MSDIADLELDFVAIQNHTAVEYCLLMEVEHLRTLHMFDVKLKVEACYWGSRRASGVATATATAVAAAHNYWAVRWCSVVGAFGKISVSRY